MEKVGVLVVSYGSRDTAIIDALARSEKYEVQLYIADRQLNPFNIEKAKRGGEHRVISSLSTHEICSFAEEYRDRIDFCIVGSEGPIIQGIRDLIEEKTDIPVVCPTREYAIEASKVSQRNLLETCYPDANPMFKVFQPKVNGAEPISDFKDWLLELGGPENAVIKPDRPGFGKGVGVGGEHFRTIEEAYAHFCSIYKGAQNERVIVEQKIEGEESSFQAFCDGKHLAVLPETRDYKRAFESDKGPNTGGMGSYKGIGELLPFMDPFDREREISIVESIFRKLTGGGSNPKLRGIPFYVAFMHTADVPKVLEINSRPGDPEIQNILPVIDQDFIDICFMMIDGELSSLKFKSMSSVVIYKVPPSYGGYSEQFPDMVDYCEAGSPVYLDDAYQLSYRNPDRLRIYPGSMELRPDGKCYALSSRTVCSVGVAPTIGEARMNALNAVKKIRGGALWYRRDIGSEEHIRRSIDHMRRLRAE
jgi:phosphoribosylamine--glycine ligase